MAIVKALKSIGVASVTPVYARARIYESMAPHAGFSLDIVRKIVVSCADLNLCMNHKWMCSMWTETKIMFLCTI
jgi:hypothetical protein